MEGNAVSDRLIRDPECGQMSGLSRSQRWRLERDGHFPKRRHASPNVVGWLESELLEWLQSLEVSVGERPKVGSQEETAA